MPQPDETLRRRAAANINRPVETSTKILLKIILIVNCTAKNCRVAVCQPIRRKSVRGKIVNQLSLNGLSSCRIRWSARGADRMEEQTRGDGAEQASVSATYRKISIPVPWAPVSRAYIRYTGLRGNHLFKAVNASDPETAPLSVLCNPVAPRSSIIAMRTKTSALFHAWLHREGYRHPAGKFTSYMAGEASLCLARGNADKAPGQSDSAYTKYYD